MYRALGLPIEIASPTAVQLSVTIFNGTTSIVLDNNDSAYINIAAGRYRPNDFINLVDNAVRTWLFNAILANAGSGAANSGNKYGKDLDFTIPEIPGKNTNPLTFRINDPHCTISGLPCTVTAASLNNSNQLWTKLGLAFETDSTVTGVIDSGQAIFTGKYQSKYLFILDRTEQETPLQEVKHYSAVHRLESGKIKRFKFGGSHFEKTLTFVDLDEAQGGGPEFFGKFYNIQAARDLIDARNPNLGGISFGPDNPYLDTAFFTSGSFINFDGHITRAIYDSVTYGASTLKLADKVPTSISMPSSGVRPYMLSEIWAFAELVESLGLFYLYASDDTGIIHWISDSYTFNKDDLTLVSARTDQGLRLYDFTVDLLAVDDDETTIVNII